MTHIINVEKQHIPEIERIEQVCFSMPWTAEQLETQLPPERNVFIAAVDDSGSILGYVGMMYIIDEGYISNVAVRPESRRQGIGDMLIEELLRRAEVLELAFVTLEVREHNEGAKALYAKHGFEYVGVRKNYYDRPRENALLMTKTY